MATRAADDGPHDRAHARLRRSRRIPEALRRFVPTVIDAIGMRAQGACDPELTAAIAVDHFGGTVQVTILHR